MERKEAVCAAVNSGLRADIDAQPYFDIAAFERALENAGYVVAEKEPTNVMLKAGTPEVETLGGSYDSAWHALACAYRAMIGARGR